MICVSIGRGRHKQMIAEHRHLVEQGAELVELRLDYIRTPVNLKRLLDGRRCPIVATVRREEDGGMWQGSEEARLILLRSAIADGVDYIDLEEDVAAGIPRFGKTKRIISYHNFRETPEDLEGLHQRLVALDPDIVKIATMAHSTHDNVRMLRLVKESKIPTVGLCMGDIGTPSRLLTGKFGAPFTYATFHQERTLAPGQLSYRQMRDIYNYDAIDEATEVFGVIADPVGHSLSPTIHNAAFRQLGMNKVYLPFRVPREDLDRFLIDCADLGIRGLSVTIPHKETILPHVANVDESASTIGAVNTVLYGGGNSGYNTDYQAAMDSLDTAVELGEGDLPLQGKTALLLGSGGVAKAVGYGLIQRGAEVIIAARSDIRGDALAKKLAGTFVHWNERYAIQEDIDILVNCTPIGMHPNVDETPFEKEYMGKSFVVFDTVYNPEQTLLIKEARDLGCRTVTGVEMFVRQAALQFKHFTDQDAPLELMQDAVRRSIGAARG